MAAHNCFRVTGCTMSSALIVVPFPLNSTNSAPLQAQNTLAVSLPADVPILNFFDHRDTGNFHSMFARFFSRGVMMNPRLISSNIAFKIIITINGILLEE